MKRILLALLFVLPVLVYATPTTLTATQFAWTAPTTFADGTAVPAGDIQGFYIYWRQNSGVYSNTSRVQIANATATTMPVSQLPTLADGEYDAAITAYDANGESAYSTDLVFNVVGGVVQVSKKLLSVPGSFTLQ